ncbi:MAG: DUF5320 domain-containing protein [Candidatus Micrarchaeia archaeon]
MPRFGRGNGIGNCGHEGYGMGYGRGFGFGLASDDAPFGYGRSYRAISKEEEKEMLEAQKASIASRKAALEALEKEIDKRLEELSAKS